MFDAGGANTKQVSRTLEVGVLVTVVIRLADHRPQYAFGDFAISQVAKILGKADDAAKVSVIKVLCVNAA